MYLTMWLCALVCCAMSAYFSLCGLSKNKILLTNGDEVEKRYVLSAIGMFGVFLALAYFCVITFKTELLFN